MDVSFWTQSRNVSPVVGIAVEKVGLGRKQREVARDNSR